MGPELATPDEVAQYLRTTPQRLNEWRYLRRGPAYVKAGRHVLYRWSDVEAFLAERTVTPRRPNAA